jgi:ABC-2 type transport system ATP-binding protein
VAALRARGLVKRFDATCAIDGVDLELAAGELRGLLGPNGAGKTTLLRMLLGLVRPDAGSIELLGSPLHERPAVARGAVAGFVEDPAFYPYLSGRANLEVLAELDGGTAARAIDEALERVDLARHARERVGTYSTGMRQRLGIAAALLRSPRLLLLDEPTSGLDPAGARAVVLLLRELAGDGVGVLVSSHLIGEVEDVCDTVTVLRHGRVAWEGTLARLRAQAPGSSFALATSDDAHALMLAGVHGVCTGRLRDGRLSISSEEAVLDRYVLALGQGGVSVRRLELVQSPLERMFFAITGEDGAAPAAAERAAEAALARP